MHGRNAYDYGARFYDPLLPTWDRIDPMCEKYYHLSPYAYCLNNPVNIIDPNGEKIVFALNSTSEFKESFNKVTQYLILHGCGEFFKILNDANETYIIRESNINAFNWENKEIEWNPNFGLNTGYTVLSPAVRLNHELDHAAEYQNNPKRFKENIKRLPVGDANELYYSIEEKRVITGSEKETATVLGETDSDGNTRDDHFGIPIKTIDPISNIPEEENLELIVYPKD